ncbi:indole-3-glycerol phosphate synthase TrpC [Mangrovibacillus cuniculi]|uniref:Indole-3-glycerol phosphate synthase n=1 Tax=Mangrovibacillus cuniculi TaxID=2593652 RepID=A0A7S8CAU0_9BACI|nr:indole-3-glycerol phosphate synthase TrpC [Mangrovibacillus cuniculi]QPC46575.1 indole-3-glycerol phosphate synthase TrpC [Mangrovibacillus cuniculi]
MTILTKIVEDKAKRIPEWKEKYEDLEVPNVKRASFIAAIKKSSDLAIIAEIKKASPSKGVLSENFAPLKIAEAYEASQVTCISVLTDEAFFQGGFPILDAVSDKVATPLLCKDFIIDPIQIKMAALHGASCILLIAAILEKEELVQLKNVADKYGLDTLVEIHNEDEWEKIKDLSFPLVGINNRNLHTFEVSLTTTLELVDAVKYSGALVISESGIFTRSDVELVAKAGVDGLLVGEAFMKTDSVATLKEEFSVRKELRV